MTRSRRDFIKSSAAIGIVGTSDASAQTRQARGEYWIGLINSTNLEPHLQLAFFEGLKQQGYQADPSEDGTGQRVNIFSVQINSKYKKGNVQNIRRAVRTITNAIPDSSLKAIVAVGGLIVGQAVAEELKTNSRNIPLVTLAGRKDSGIQSYAYAEGYYFDDIHEATNRSLQLKLSKLTDHYQFRPANNYNAICLLYNGNSAMGSNELAEWKAVLQPYGVVAASLDAVTTSPNTQNERINLRKAFGDAKEKQPPAQAIMLSSDPHFTRNIQKIIRLAKDSGLVMCYPLLDYADDSFDANVPDGKYMAYGPRLKDVYTNIGDLTGLRLKDSGRTYEFTQVVSDYVGRSS